MRPSRSPKEARDLVIVEGKKMLKKMSGVSKVYEGSVEALQNLIEVVKSLSIFRPEVLKRYGVDVPSLVEDLGKAIEDVFKDMKDNFTLRSIEKESAFLQHLDVQLSDILDKIEGAFIKTFVAFRMKKDLVRQELKLVRSPMRVFVLVSGE